MTVKEAYTTGVDDYFQKRAIVSPAALGGIVGGGVGMLPGLAMIGGLGSPFNYPKAVQGIARATSKIRKGGVSPEMLKKLKAIIFRNKMKTVGEKVYRTGLGVVPTAIGGALGSML